MAVARPSRFQAVGAHQRAAGRVLADEPARELQHLDAGVRRRRLVVPERRQPEAPFERELAVGRFEAGRETVAQPRLGDDAERQIQEAVAPEVEPAHHHGVVHEVDHRSGPVGAHDLAPPHGAVRPVEGLLRGGAPAAAA
jgi:hypothetical protein